jgi:2,4-dienoyl-CoA reductase-like NADH-dependent reductase (Old Yellow Enzyme family)/thioredoxin reductase
MSEPALNHLMSPVHFGPAELQNRIVSTAHQTTLVHEHLPTDDFVAYHEARARGGAGLIVLEATAVHESGLLTPHTLGGFLPEIVDGYRRVAAAVQPHGTKLFVQLFHGGREQIADAPRTPAVAPSAVPSARFRIEPRALRGTEIEEIVAGYARAAELAAEAGLDGVEISAAHRYLIEQFFDPALNRRSDEWRDGRKFALAVVRAVRAAVEDLCLGIRLSADSERAPLIEEALAGEVDYVSLALGDSSTYRGSVGIVPPPPLTHERIDGASSSVPPRAPRILTSRLVDPATADALIAAGHADAVGMTRALITDPDLPAKARTGELRTLIRCIGCNACIAHYHAGTPIACAVNPRTGRERHLTVAPRTTEPKRLVVVGGGPAGVAAAWTAAESGHEVVLFERTPYLGGQLALARSAPGGRDVASAFADNTHRLLDGVDVRVDCEASVAEVLALEPDAVVVATGARPYVDSELRLDDLEVLQAWDVLAGNLPTGNRIVVADWGGDPAGLDAAEMLAAAGQQVTLAVASVAVGEQVHQYRRNLYLARLYESGVTIVHHLALVSAARGEVSFRNVFAPALTHRVAADGLVLALGRVPADSFAPELAAQGIAIAEAGDCLSPRSLEEAMLEGTLAARRLVA